MEFIEQLTAYQVDAYSHYRCQGNGRDVLYHNCQNAYMEHHVKPTYDQWSADFKQLKDFKSATQNEINLVIKYYKGNPPPSRKSS